MNKLEIKFVDGKCEIHKLKDCQSWRCRLDSHPKSYVKSATLQRYPLKDNEIINVIPEWGRVRGL